tara:strand:+ start:30 stop:509 length:480 start_codon:yes stop_codon:yes gene_type:complete
MGKVMKNMNSRLGYIIVVTFWIIILMTLTSCYGTYYLTDSEYIDAREDHASVTYYNSQIYWGWSNGYYYYYGIPHYYPWTYYYNTCPPSHHTTSTHIVVNRPVNRPTHRPNRPTIKTNTTRNIIRTNGNKTTIKTNSNRNIIRTNVKTNKKVTNRRRPK